VCCVLLYTKLFCYIVLFSPCHYLSTEENHSKNGIPQEKKFAIDRRYIIQNEWLSGENLRSSRETPIRKRRIDQRKYLQEACPTVKK